MAEPIAAVQLGKIGEIDNVGGNPLTIAGTQEVETPFQQLLDNALSSLEAVSKTEEKANVYMQEYVKGNVSMEDVIIETTKMQLAMELAITVVNQTVSTFKELQQIQV